jgi:hypothetical protein
VGSNNKISLKPFAQGKTYSNKPFKEVEVKGKTAYAGIKGEYKTKKGTTIKGSAAKSFDIGKVNFPGGSESWKGSTKPEYKIEIEKKFGGPKKPDLSDFIENKSQGGMMDYYKDII